MANCPPVLLIVFNRPDLTARVFDAIRRQRPARLYIAADGPRDPSAHPNDARLCRETREIASTIEWPCELVTRFSEENHGCGRGVSDAISWFFQHEPAGIVLEDDCLPADDFFPYCAELLERYQDRHEVMHICGNNFAAPDAMKTCAGYSYAFGRYAQVWGWASWARAWRHFHFDVGSSVEESSHFKIHGIDIYRRFAHQERVRSTLPPVSVDTWDYQWQFAVLKNGGLSVCPSVNLISNLGFGEDATHTFKADAPVARTPLGRLPFPLSHPSEIIDSPAINRIYADRMLGHPKRHRKKFYKSLLRRITGLSPKIR